MAAEQVTRSIKREERRELWKRVAGGEEEEEKGRSADLCMTMGRGPNMAAGQAPLGHFGHLRILQVSQSCILLRFAQSAHHHITVQDTASKM